MSAQTVYLDSTRTDVGTPIFDETAHAILRRHVDETAPRYSWRDRLFVAAFITAVIGAVLLAVTR